MLFTTDKQVIVPQCEGCSHVQVVGDQSFCDAYANPSAKWMLGACPLGTHVQRQNIDASKKVNLLKASKKASKGKG